MTSRISVRRALLGLVAITVVVLLVLQIIPYGRDHNNPPVLAEIQWDSARTRELAVKACYDCHSNETHWPWYSNIAPLSWVVQHDVEEGRDELNFSEWVGRHDSGEIIEAVAEGEMPPMAYKLRFWDQLSNSERDELLAGIRATFGIAELRSLSSGNN